MKIVSREFLPIKSQTCHAATISFFKGYPVFSWFGGSREGMPDVSIFLYNLHGDKQFITIGNKDSIPRWNPILFSHKNKLSLFTKAGAFCDRWATFRHDITDWTHDICNKEIMATAHYLPAGLNGPVKTKPIEYGGNILCGSSVETFCDWSSYIETYSSTFKFISRSNNLSVPEKYQFMDYNGATRLSMGVIQPSLWIDAKDNSLHCFLRSSRGLGKIYESDYINDEWCTPYPTNLDNPNSGIDTLFYNNKLYVVHNPSQDNREPLVIRQIERNGNEFNFNRYTCNEELVINEKMSENSPFASPELSYPYIIEHGGLFHCVYTYGRVKIEYVVIEP